MTITRVVAVVGKERWRSSLQLGTSLGGVHDLVANEDSRLGGHACADGGQDSDTVFVGPIVPDRIN